MINLKALLPHHLIDASDEELSAVCVRTSEIKYLIFGEKFDAPLYVVQFGSIKNLSVIFEFTSHLYASLPDRIPEPLELSTISEDRAVLVQRGLAGRPWFTLRDEIRTLKDWLRIKNLSLNALHDLHKTSASQRDWTHTIDLVNMFDDLHAECRQNISKPIVLRQDAVARQRGMIEALGQLNCFYQHGDFGINNLLFDQYSAGIVDFEQFGRVLLPLHDEFLLTGSLLSLHPERDVNTDRNLWQEIFEHSRYHDVLGPDTIGPLFLMSIMWWILETDEKTHRTPRCERYHLSLDRILNSRDDGVGWIPGDTVI